MMIKPHKRAKQILITAPHGQVAKADSLVTPLGREVSKKIKFSQNAKRCKDRLLDIK